jgi:acyl-CoA thioester hydrolase
MRHDPRRTSLDLYPIQRTITTLFSDTDALGHINNISIARYFEQARVMIMEAIAPEHGSPLFERAVLARVEIDYLSEVFYPHEVVIATGILRVGTSSLTVGSALFQQGRCVALADSIDVSTALGGGPRPITDDARAVLDKFLLDLPA